MERSIFSRGYKKQEWNFDHLSSLVGDLYSKLKTNEKGLSEEEALKRLNDYGPNEIKTKKEKILIFEFLGRFLNPLVIILLVIASFSFFFGDKISTIIISLMVLMSITLSFFQERRAESAAQKLEEMVQTMCTVVRNGKIKEIPLKSIVPGDIVDLSAGDIIPGDIRIVSSKDLFINQSSLTGESFPVEKFAEAQADKNTELLRLPNMAFMGSSVVSGIGMGIVIHTGQNTAFGNLSQKLIEASGKTLFDTQTKDFVWTMIKVMAIVVTAIMLIYALKRQNILESLLFALAVAVQITPETLPMFITINLSKGALAMSRKRAIVKRLNSIQNLGAMDILCSDKTGTLTLNEVVLQNHVNVWGEKDENVFIYGYVNCFYQTGTKNLINEAVLKHKREDLHGYKKIDEIPFDFERRISSVVVENKGEEFMVSIGAPEEIFKRCVNYDNRGKVEPINQSDKEQVLKEYYELGVEGYRVIAVAYKDIKEKKSNYSLEEEHNLILKGYMAFFDPPKSTAKASIDALREAGIEFKIVTGDSDVVTKKICNDLNIGICGVIVGSQIDSMSDEELSKASEDTTIFARVTPEQKERIIRCLRLKGHTVGFLGDGINDALSLRAADIGISVNNAVDVAKESASIVLLEKDLDALTEGILEGRKVFGNFMKYIRMTSMVNVGYMVTTIGASLVLPFLPMHPVQLLLNNYLYEVGQTAIPSDNVDSDYVKKPRKWRISSLVNFMTFLGPLSSIFDFIMFGILWWVFHAYANESIFQTGWFIQTMLAQVLLIFFIRTKKIPFLESRPSAFLVLMSIIILGIVLVLPFTSLAAPLHLVIMPWTFYPVVALIVLTYLMVVWFTKNLLTTKVEND